MTRSSTNLWVCESKEARAGNSRGNGWTQTPGSESVCPPRPSPSTSHKPDTNRDTPYHSSQAFTPSASPGEIREAPYLSYHWHRRLAATTTAHGRRHRPERRRRHYDRVLSLSREEVSGCLEGVPAVSVISLRRCALGTKGGGLSCDPHRAGQGSEPTTAGNVVWGLGGDQSKPRRATHLWNTTLLADDSVSLAK